MNLPNIEAMTRQPLPLVNHFVLRHHTAVALSFALLADANTDQLVAELQDALDGIVSENPFLGGWVDVDPDTSVVSLLSPHHDARVLLQEQDKPRGMPSTHAELEAAEFPISAFEGLELFEKVATASQAGAVLHVHYTIIDGGIVLWFYFHHILADGSCIHNIIEDIAARTRSPDSKVNQMHTWPKDGPLRSLLTPTSLHLNGDSHDNPRPPCLESLLKECPEFTTIHPDGIIPDAFPLNTHTPTSPRLRNVPSTEASSTMIFVFKTSHLKSFCLGIKEAANLPKLPSVHASLGALSWWCILKARSSSVEEYTRSGTAKLLTPVNWRPRAFGDQTEGFYGNGALNVICEMPTSTVQQATSDFHFLGQITTTLEESFTRVNEDFVTKRLDLFKVADPKATYINIDFSDEAQIAFNTWRYFIADSVWGLSGLDVTNSKGKPACVRKFQKGSVDGVLLVLPSRRDSGEVHLMVSLRHGAAEELCKERDWMRWVDRVIV